MLTATPSSAAGALGYLVAKSLANRAARAAARLRSPRYLVALIAGLAYFGWFFGSVLGREGPRAGRLAALPPGLLELAPLALFALAVVWWTTGRHHRALAFSPAEVHFLFGAPLTRKQLVRYKLARRQLSLLLTVALASLYLWALGRTTDPAAVLLRAAGLWVLLTTLQLHQVGASLVRVAAAEQGRAGLRHQGLPLLLGGAALLVLLSAVAPVVPTLLLSGERGAGLAALAEALAHPAPRAVLLPFRWTLGPTLASGAAEWLAALPGALLLLGLNYLWVMRRDAAFEEGAAEAGRHQAERLGTRGRERAAPLAPGERVGPPAFRLAPSGWPALAVVWKNLTLARRRLPRAQAALLAAAIPAIYLVTRSTTGSPREAAALCATLALGLAGFAIIAGPLAVRIDLRADLPRIALLRTFPLRGRDLVAAELAASTTLLTAVQLLLLTAGGVFLLAAVRRADPAWVVAGLAGAALLLPPVNALTLGAQNWVALLFPGWARLGVERPGGVEQMGMNVLTLLATFTFLALALVPVALVAGGLGWALWRPLGWTAALPAALAGWTVLLAEVAAFVRLLGARWDALDPAEVGLLE